jgi:osmotically-inducible protein OsmY
MTDETIKKLVTDQLYWDHRVDSSEVKIAVDDQVVTLEGTVPNYAAREAAFDDAHDVTGVQGVVNNLEIDYTIEPELPTDANIEKFVTDRFRWDPNLKSFKIDVSVDNGWATLEGTVDAYWKKIRAEVKAADVLGVVGVINNLAVVPTESIKDEVIAKNVVEALERNVNVFAQDVNVKVETGIVTLSGEVASWAARSAAYDAAMFTYGVLDVFDNLRVKI